MFSGLKLKKYFQYFIKLLLDGVYILNIISVYNTKIRM